MSKNSYISLDRWVWDHMITRALPPTTTKLLMELCYRKTKDNNGKIRLGVNEAANALNLSKNTVRKAFYILENCGYIKCTYKGAYNIKFKRSSEWEIRFYQGGDKEKDYFAVTSLDKAKAIIKNAKNVIEKKSRD